MIPRECKRLAEVDFPIAAVSRHAVREKSIRHGHPSTLHLWWARRPLASCRAMLMALLLPDPCDPLCPAAFRSDARRIMLGMHGRPQGWARKAKSDDGLRGIILEFIAKFANWDNAASDTYLKVSRALVKTAHGDEAPLIVDPFAGGGSIPLEALRLGCDAFASDLNPVSCLILKVMLEDIPCKGLELADDLRKRGEEIKQHAKRELADLYPVDADGAKPIAYLWARTVRCEAPKCGAEIPLMRSFWLCKKSKRKRALRHRIIRQQGRTPHVEFEVFEPTADEEVRGSTVARAKAKCLCCGAVLPAARVRAQLSAMQGGADVVFNARGSRIGGARMTAVVTLRSEETGRNYRLPTDHDYVAVHRAQARVAKIVEDWENAGRCGLSPVPNEVISLNEIRRISVPIYGMSSWGDLFTARQKAALIELGRLIAGNEEHRTRNALGLACSKLSELSCSICAWEPFAECPRHAFGRQAVPIAWDFSEGVPTSGSSGSFGISAGHVASGMESIGHVAGSFTLEPADAAEHPLPDEAADIWFTDPPYYDAVPYAHLADFFFVWLKRILPDHSILNSPFEVGSSTTPKAREIVVDRPHRLSKSTKDAEFYETGMARAFAEGHRVLRREGIGSVVFAHKTTEGWEALLSGMIRGGWTITASWPIATEMGSRLNARETASLATSIHLVCRPRPDDAPIGDWADVLRELPIRVGDWMERLQEEGVRGADLVFACVGPALEIFSRYSRVETAEGDEIELPVYLERVWEVVGRTALENVLGTDEARARNGQAGVLEEDARLTALFLWTMQSTDSVRDAGSTEDADEGAAAKVGGKGFKLPFDVVRRFAQPMGINLEKWTDRIVEQKKGFVRLLPVTSRAAALFGHEGAQAAADWIESDPAASLQHTLFPETEALPKPTKRRRGKKSIIDENAELQSLEATALDRVHAAMLLQSNGHSNALRKLIVAEQERGPEFLRLANSLSALYPLGSDEKRLLDGMLLAVPR